MKTAIGYLRKSRITSDRHVSWEVQEREIRSLAERNGDGDLELLSDWGKSGRGERTKYRPEYLRLRAMIEADEVSVLYSYSLSRLSRSLTEYADLAKLCEAHGVRVRLCKEGEFDYGSASGRFNVGILALLAQMEAELAQERARDTLRERKARGDHIGSAGYGKRLNGGKLEDHPKEDVDRIAAAFAEAGSYAGAAKLLNAAGVRTKTGRGEWAQTSVARVLRRAGMAPPARRDQAGVRMRGTFKLSRLLVCPCGNVMTGRRTKHTTKYGSYGPYVSYQCFRGRSVVDHPRPYMVSEAALIDWVKDQAGRFRVPQGQTAVDDGAEARRAELSEQRRRLAMAFARGGLQDEDYAAEDARLTADLEAIEDRAAMRIIPLSIDWRATPDAAINRVLTTYWRSVQLGADMRPLAADWKIPAEYLA